jgi:NosR/NirI family transcriptional regulator, nitrous oxide reductase regulator
MSRAGGWTGWARHLRARWSDRGAAYGPRLGPGGSTSVPGLFVAGSLAGAESFREAVQGAMSTVQRIHCQAAVRSSPLPAGTRDLVIVGGGAAGFAAAVAARAAGLGCEVIAAHKPVARLDQFLAQAGEAVRIARAVRIEQAEGHLRVRLAGGDALEAWRVVVATGRGGCPGRLDLPGEELDHVFHRLHDPAGFAGRRVVVVGGGQCSALAAIALAEHGAEVTLLYRGAVLTRPRFRTLSRLSELLAGAPTEPFRRGKPRSAVPRRTPGPGTVALRLMTRLLGIRSREAVLGPADGPPETVATDAVLVLVGRDPDDALLERSGVEMHGGGPSTR